MATKYTSIHNPTSRTHSVFVCFVWISEQTAIISLYTINWVVFIAETECVYCAVRTGSLNIIDWLVFITETECLLCGTDWVFKYN